ncbi:amidohydrolase [Streptomyces sp. LN325]|uniref:amidohydrolase n=1 Tax=Streptomyces sp. LN325 TaxID=3112976 RepID=UPI003715EE4C
MSESTAPSDTVLLRGGEVHSPADPFATAMVVERGQIAWVGSEGAADAFADGVAEVVDLEGALVTPAFTDAHVHTTATASRSPASTSATRPPWTRPSPSYATSPPPAPPTGSCSATAGTRPAGPAAAPTRAELDEAAGGRPLYLSRIDVHSAVATTALLDMVPGVTGRTGYQDGPLTRDAHHAVRAAALGAVTARQRTEAQRAALAHAASLGIGSVHECAGPDISSEDDLTGLLRLAAEERGPRVVGYWAEPGEEGVAKARELGAVGAAGDLFVDGSLGSYTACLHQPYADAGHSGTAYLDDAAVAAHVIACTEAGLQAGFHAIGDAAVTSVVEGVRAAAEKVGLARVRAARHRVEHAEMLTPETIASFAEFGLTASVQPAFDALWGGEDGMYAQRLGVERARTLNPLAALLRTGVPLAFGSDSPVTPLDPWGTVRAAAFHRTPEHRVSVRAAFTAHTRGGWRAIGRDDAGVLVPGAPADYAVWGTGELVVQAPDDRVARWSTDPRSGTPGLPDLSPGGDLPVCLRTVVGGRTVFVRPGE